MSKQSENAERTPDLAAELARRAQTERALRALLAEAKQKELCSESESKQSPLVHQEGGDHYRRMKIQPIEFIQANGLTFLEGSVLKRVCRHRHKDGAKDIRKAIHELQLILQMEYPDE